jgi:alanyl-tRNA synthetase
VRLVEIFGLDCNTCGGTHLASTAEIETVALLGTESMRGGTRLHWVAGGRVRRRLRARETAAAALRRTFETSDEELLQVATAKLERSDQAQRVIKRLRNQLARETALRLTHTSEPLISAHFQDRDAGFLQVVARELAACGDNRPAFLTSEGESGLFFVVWAPPASGLDLRAAGSFIAEILDGRGGGSAGLIQGKAGSLQRRDDAEAALAAEIGDPRA